MVKSMNLNIDSHTKAGEPTKNWRVSSIQSPNLSSGRTNLERNDTKGSPRNKRDTTEHKQKEKIIMFVTKDESYSISESTFSSSFQFDVVV